MFPICSYLNRIRVKLISLSNSLGLSKVASSSLHSTYCWCTGFPPIPFHDNISPVLLLCTYLYTSVCSTLIWSVVLCSGTRPIWKQLRTFYSRSNGISLLIILQNSFSKWLSTVMPLMLFRWYFSLSLKIGTIFFSFMFPKNAPILVLQVQCWLFR